MTLMTVAAALGAGCGGARAAGGPAGTGAATWSSGPTTSPTTEAVSTTAQATTTAPVPATTTTSTTTRPSPATTVPPVATTARSRVAAAATCPAGLASRLTYTSSARQLVTVVASGYGTPDATVELWQKTGACWTAVGGPWPSLIGESGFSDHHREGDGSSPTGFYGLGPVMYGNAPDPGVQEPYHRLVCGDWWDENPSSPEYNTFQHVACGTTPSWAPGSGSEALWQETAPYPSFAVIDYNTGPVVAGAGSAIFFHADTGSPTVGCVSVPLADLDLALRWLDPALAPAFVMGPASEITRF